MVLREAFERVHQVPPTEGHEHPLGEIWYMKPPQLWIYSLFSGLSIVDWYVQTAKLPDDFRVNCLNDRLVSHVRDFVQETILPRSLLR